MILQGGMASESALDTRVSNIALVTPWWLDHIVDPLQVNRHLLMDYMSDSRLFMPEPTYNNPIAILDKLREGQTKKIIENSNVVEITKKNGQITRKPLIKNWTDWIDYWSVDFDYESKIEVVKTNTDGKETFQHTGNYIFENEWQDFIYRTKGEDKIMIKTPYYQIRKKNIKIAIRVIDIFANDTMIIKEINK